MSKTGINNYLFSSEGYSIYLRSNLITPEGVVNENKINLIISIIILIL